MCSLARALAAHIHNRALAARMHIVGTYSLTCLKRAFKIGTTNVLKTDGSLMQRERIAECSLGAFFNTLDLH